MTRGIHMKLTEEKSEEILEAIRNVGNMLVLNQNRNYIPEYLKHYLDMFPKWMNDIVIGLADPISQIDYLFVEGVDLPVVNGNSKNDYLSEILLSYLALALGEPFVAEGHRDGQVFLDMIPKQSDENMELGTGTELGWHSEDAHLEYPAKYICLLGLRGDLEAKTFISKPEINQLESNYLLQLRSRSFTVVSDDSYNKVHKHTHPVVNENSVDGIELRLDPNFTINTTQSQDEAIQMLLVNLEKNKKEFCLGRGDILIFNNRRCAHRRSDFKPSYDLRDRWIQRIMVV